MITIAGGWGYYNLGDEAILAGYLETLGDVDRVSVLSVDRLRTQQAQRLAPRFTSELSVSKVKVPGNSDRFLLAGGGYLNGRWRPEIYLKLARLRTHRGRLPMVGHGLELRRLDSFPTNTLAKSLFNSSEVAVRDEKSLEVSRSIGIAGAKVLPDSISLLAPHTRKYEYDIPEVKGKVLVNLLDIGQRGDADEAEIDVANWEDYCRELISVLGDRAVGLVVGGGDRKFLNSLDGLRIVEPTSVAQLISLISGAAGIVSVRMHPALIGTIVGTPTVSVPYCGKVTPTLKAIGVDKVIQRNLSVGDTLDRLEGAADGFEREWAQAEKANREWLVANLDL